MAITVLFIGDIVGRPGRNVVKQMTRSLIKEHGVHLAIANGENAASGKGITRDTMNEILDAGIDVLTMGNHVWDNRDVFNFIDHEPRMIRPANYPDPCPGRGFGVFTAANGYRVGIISLAGRVFMPQVDCEFRKADELIEAVRPLCEAIIVDLHAEATSEKIAFGYYVDGRVSAVIGTHTHVQTADERVLPGGTGYISDVGMTGPLDGVIGVRREEVLERFITGRPTRFQVAGGAVQMNAVLLSLDEETGKCLKIRRIYERTGA